MILNGDKFNRPVCVVWFGLERLASASEGEGIMEFWRHGNGIVKAMNVI